MIYRKWGSAKHLTRALFAQGEIWVTAKSEVRKIAEMPEEHCLNTLLMLERMAGDLEEALAEDLQTTVLYHALLTRVSDALPPENPVAAYDPLAPWWERERCNREPEGDSL